MEVAQVSPPAMAAGPLGPLPDLSRTRSLTSKIRVPEIPRPLLDRHRWTPSALALKRSVRRGATGRGRRLVQRLTMGWTLFEQERVEALGTRRYLEEQLHPEAIDDHGLEQALEEALPSLAMTPGERLLTYYEEPQIQVLELLVATVIRAVYSPRQLLERLAVFWTDHFNIYLFGERGIWLKPTDDREVVRRHALGTFPELLRASARSPAMLDYLTNDSNVRGHPNENYARELMELHTMGVDGGYTEQDVKEVARCFTGWTYRGFRAGPAFGAFRFDPRHHDFGEKTVLGRRIPAGGGIRDGETVLHILAGHPSTARFIAGKLLGYFWGYEPPERLVEAVAEVYLATGGDIRSMLRSIFRRKDPAASFAKTKRPYHLIVSAVRALFAQLEHPFFLLRAAEMAGHLPYTWPPPNGFPDSAGYWSGYLLPRWNFASLLLTHDESGVGVDLPFLDPSLPAEELLSILDLLLLGGAMTPATRDALRAFLAAGTVTPARLRAAIGLAVASPEFQEY